MKKETRTVVHDDLLHLEAYRFEGIAQPFPNHFHEYYVIGFMEGGTRSLTCKNREYTIQKGNIILFNPGDNHTCVQSGHGLLDYRALNIPKETMLDLAEEITSLCVLPGFSANVLSDAEAACYLRPLHEMIMTNTDDFGREENLLLLIALLIQRYGQPFADCTPECRDEVENACQFIQQHYAEHLTLEQIGRCAGLSKSTLLRAFTHTKGVTPYSYLINVRIGQAKKLLEQGIPPVEAALQTGFSDQSHFTNYFSRFIGLAPGAYREIFLPKEIHETAGDNQ